jgi:hypothetical protein
VKRTLILALLAGLVTLLSGSCGTSDYLESLTLTSNGASAGGFFNLAGVDGTIQLAVTANYHSGKKIDVTNNSTFTMVPTGTYLYTADSVNYPAPGPVPAPGPNVVTISPTGLMTGIAPICTWKDALATTSTGCPNGETSCQLPANPPIWEYTGYYQTTATYRNFTSQPVGVGLGVAASDSPTGGCGPT